MNLNGDEKRIRQLFREMSLDDQRRAPEFASVLASSTSGMARSQNRIRSLRFATAVAIVCVTLLIAMAIIVRSSKPQVTVAPDAQASAPTVPPESPPDISPSGPEMASGVEPHKNVIKRARRRRPSNHIETAMKSLFAWQSPTASLLQTPDDELLRSLPRLGESLRTIKSFSPDEFN